MKSSRNKTSTDNFDAESTNRPISEKVSRPRRRFESSNTSQSTTRRQTASDSTSHIEKTEVLPSSSSQNIGPGAVAVTGAKGSGDHVAWFSPSLSEEIVDVETGGNRSDIEVVSHRLVEDENNNSVIYKTDPMVMETMIHAELVTPPVEALRVTAEEDSNFPSEYQHHSSPDDSQSDSADKDSSTSRGTGVFQRQWGRMHWTVLLLLLLLLLVIIICAIVFPVVFSSAREDSPIFPYDCFRTTREVLEAQAQALRENGLADESLLLIMCPGTRDVGVYKDAENGDLRFARGDYPLMANVVIQCGLDGKRDNSCVLNGGLMQVSTFENVTLPDGTKLIGIDPVHNMTIRGMTFRGDITERRGVSVSLRHPSQNIQFEDCLWTDMTAPEGLIRLQEHNNEVLVIDEGVSVVVQGIQVVPPDEVTFSNCTFQNIVYDGPLIHVVNEKLTVENSIFRDIRVSNRAAGECNHIYSRNEGRLNYFEGCASLLSCSPKSDCSLHDSCVENVGYKGPGLVVAHEGTHGAYNRTRLDYKGMYLDPSSETPCELARIPDFDTTAPICSRIFEETACQVSSF